MSLAALSRLAEERIREALARGELDDLPGQGAPLRLDDDTSVPEELRAAYRVLRNAGFVPEPVRLGRALGSAEALLEEAQDGPARNLALGRLEVLRARMAAAPGGERWLRVHDAYRRQVLEAFSTRR